MAKELAEEGYSFMATEGTKKFLMDNGIEAKQVKKIDEGIPNILDIIRSGMVDTVINTPTKANDSKRHGFQIRRTAIEGGVSVLTSLDTVRGMVHLVKRPVEEMKVYNLGQGGNFHV